MHDDPLDWQAVRATIAETCARGGLDIVHAFGIEREPSSDSALAQLAPSRFGRARALGLLIGNSRALWPAFEREIEHDPALEADPDPLDRYVARVVERARNKLPIRSVVRFAHLGEPQPIPVQRIAHEVGLAHLSPSHLSIHPEYGPWLALRAVLSIDVEGPAPLAPPPDPCARCAKPCLGALRTATAVASETPDALAVISHWREWLAVRDVCPEGRSSRYGEEQIAYHYARDRRWSRSRSG